MLRVSLDERHKSFHALFEHSSVSQGHGLELWKEVYCVFLEFHLLQGALYRDHCQFSGWNHLIPKTSASANKTKGQTIHFNLKSEAMKPKSNPSISHGLKSILNFLKKILKSDFT